MKRWLNILIIVCVLLTTSSLKAEDRPTLPKTPEGKVDVNNLLYGGFLDIKNFWKELTYVYFEGVDINKIGLGENGVNKLNDYLRLKIRNNFTDIRFAETDDYKDKHTGHILVRAWTVGDSYLAVLHLSAKFNSYNAGTIKEEERLWYGQRVDVLDTIKKGIGEMIEDLAVTFYKVRGEL